MPMKTRHYFLIFWLGVAFSGTFCLSLSAQNRIVIVNECDGYSDNVNHFLRNMENKLGGVNLGPLGTPIANLMTPSPTLYTYPRLEELAYWHGNSTHSRKNIQNLQTSCLVAETVGQTLSSEGDTIRVLNPGELTVLKGYWNLLDKEMDADTLRNRLRNLLCDRHKCDTLLLLTSCLSDFGLRSWKEPGKKPRDVSGEADLTVRTGWAVYDRKTGKIVEEFQAKGKASDAWNRITREQAYKLRHNQFSTKLITDSLERVAFNVPFNQGPYIPTIRDLSTFHYGEPAIYPLIRTAAKQIADRLQENGINEN